jgi:hypothetical protein
MHAENTDGELQLRETGESVARLRGRLALSTPATAKPDPKVPPTPVRLRRPGQRLPTRDPVGRVGANAASL